ncbi:MAG: lysophospholipid acyltransferase family protein [Terrimicrobiaceae bacterium]|nr:lysophospholipid acyltransferase family protein [Terrimicrobiaceae bacterium]
MSAAAAKPASQASAARPSLRQRAEYAGLRLAEAVASRLPFQALAPLGRAVAALVWACDPRGRRVALANLEAAFGAEMPTARRRRVAFASYANFARTMASLLWARHFDAAAVARHIRIEGLNLTPVNTTRGAAAIYPTFHFSNFEWAGLLCAMTLEPAPIIAQRFRNPLLGPVFDRLRGATGHTVIPQEGAMLKMLRHLKRGGKFGMLADLTLDPREGGVIIRQFGGLLACVTPLHGVLALRTGAAVIPLVMMPGEGGGYRAVYHKPVAFDAHTPAWEIAQKTWDVLEPAIRAHPECWLWSYKHWRFRPEGADSRYPFYSNRAARFDTLWRSQFPAGEGRV